MSALEYERPTREKDGVGALIDWFTFGKYFPG